MSKLGYNIKGFALIELLVVVAIIGILAAVGTVAYNGYTSATKKTIAFQNHKLIVKQFKALIVEYDLNGSINKKINGGSIQNFTQKNLAFDCPSLQHHFKDIKSPYADSAAKNKDQDNQGWAGQCCNYGKEGRTYIWSKDGGYCTFSTFIDSSELIYDEVLWSN